MKKRLMVSTCTVSLLKRIVSGIGLLWAADTVWVGWPSWVPLRALDCLPAVEKLAVDSLRSRVLIRTWQQPEVVSCEAPIVVTWPMLPDTGYPKLDSTIPVWSSLPPAEDERRTLWTLLVIGGVVLAIGLLLKPIYETLETIARQLYWRWRWLRFLWRYHPKKGIPFDRYALAVLDLLAPYSRFNPRSLTPADLARLSGPEPLQAALKHVLLPFYYQRYHHQPVSQPASVYQRSWELLASWRKAAADPTKAPLYLR